MHMKIAFKRLEEYKQYIILDKIINNNLYEHIHDISWNIDIFKKTLDDLEEYNTNNTYVYFNCVYYYSRGEITTILDLANNIKDANIYTLIADYYHYIEKNYNMMKKYYLMAIELKNCFAMNGLGNYYENIERNYELMKKYYLMAIDLDNETTKLQFWLYCNIFESDYNYYKYIYYPRILTLVLTSLQSNKKNKSKQIHGKTHILFLPEEIYYKIYEDYLIND